MQLLTLLLVALGATSCASPVDTAEVDFNGTTSSTTEHHLEKRGTYGWISSYATMDFNCRGGYAGARPQIKGDCVNFTPVKGGGNIGVSIPSAYLLSLVLLSLPFFGLFPFLLFCPSPLTSTLFHPFLQSLLCLYLLFFIPCYPPATSSVPHL